MQRLEGSPPGQMEVIERQSGPFPPADAEWYALDNQKL